MTNKRSKEDAKPHEKRLKTSNHDDENVNQFIPHCNYNRVISNERVMKYVNGKRPKPIDELTKSRDNTGAQRLKIQVNKGVMFWFRTDRRINDNRGLSKAFRAAQDFRVPLIRLYLVPLTLWRCNGISNCNADFMMRSATILYDDFKELNIGFLIRLSENEAEDILAIAKQHECGHIYAKIEYEVDKLRRGARLVQIMLGKQGTIHLSHDTCVVTPGELLTKSSNTPFTVHSPFYKSWVDNLFQSPQALLPNRKLQKLEVAPQNLDDTFNSPVLPAGFCLGGERE